MQSQYFLDLLKASLFDLNNTTRAQSEQAILNLMNTNIDDVLRASAEQFINEAGDVGLRMSCTTIIRRCCQIYHPQTKMSLWLNAQQDTRVGVRKAMLMMLIANNDQIRRHAANTISAIFTVELPHGLWPELIKLLVENSSQQKPILIRQSAIMTLGFICESLKNANITAINQEEAHTILVGICQGGADSEESGECRIIAIKALQDSLYFLRPQFENGDIRTYVKQLLLVATQAANVQLKIQSLQCLIDFCKQLFVHLPPYLNDILSCTAVYFENPNEKLSIPAIEVWTQIGQDIKDAKESTILHKSQIKDQQTEEFIRANQNTILHPLMTNLVSQKQSDDDDGEGLSIQSSSQKALSILFEVIGQSCMDTVSGFISNTIQRPEWIYKKAACQVFQAITDTVDNQQVSSLIFLGIPSIMGLLTDKHQRVQIAACDALAAAAEQYPQCFLQHSQVTTIIQNLLFSLNTKVDLLQKMAWTIVQITEHLGKFPNSQFMVQKFLIMQHLASSAIRQDIPVSKCHIIDTCFMGVLNIIYTLDKSSDCRNFLVEFIQQILQLCSPQCYAYQAQIKEHILSGLLSVLHGCLVRVDSRDITEKEITEVMQIALSKDIPVKSDQFYALSGLASCLKKQFKPYAEVSFTLLGPALQQLDDLESFKGALFCLSDIARCLEHEFTPWLNVIEYLFSLIYNQSLSIDLKIQVYNAIADVVLGVKHDSKAYLPQLIQILSLGLDGCTLLARSQDPQNVDQSERFKEALIGFYTCLLHAYNDQNLPYHEMLNTIQPMFSFIENTCQKSLMPTVDYAKMCLNCMFDIANFYQKSDLVRHFITSSFVTDFMQTLWKYRKTDKELNDSLRYCCDLLLHQYAYRLSLSE